MLKKKIKHIENWFTDYTAGFHGVDEYIDTNVRLKTLHTFEVAREMATLADELALSDEYRDIAVLTGLLHDCGRFEQLAKYRTFKDAESEDHALIGLRVMDEHGLINELPFAMRQMIKEAVRCHSAIRIELAAGCPADTELFAKMIRDADKVDIFRVVQASYELYVKNPEKAGKIAITFGKDTGECSPAVLDDLLGRRQVNYERLKTLDDRKLLQLCWIYDINYPQSLEKILTRGYIQMILDALPPTEQMEQAKTAVRQYVKEILPKYKW